MTDRADERTAETPTKNLGDYGVEVEKALENNNAGMVAPIVVEMRAAAPPPEPEPEIEGESREDREARKAREAEAREAEAPPPQNLGLAGFADALDTAAQTNNVVQARKIAADMKVCEPPNEPAEGAPAGDPPVGTTYAERRE